jgi:hypothetical protein
MPYYRLYCLDGYTHIANGEWFNAKDDAEAIALVQGQKQPGRCEIWMRDRLVAVVDPQDP